MKTIKLLCFSLFCLMALTVNAQRCAVLEFKAGVGISQNDVDGISAIFITYFQPAGYTMVERTQIDKVIEEQGFQRSKMTQQQMVRVGQILNVSKIVVGDINVVQGQYNVDARVINVETGTIAATEGATFSTTSYRANMQNVAQKLAGKIAITPGSTVKPQPAPQNPTLKQRTSVEVLYGYLKIYPVEIGVFQAEPTSVIGHINEQAQYGYNNWRIPTNEELSLMRANNYLGSGEYMTKESKHGIVLLVSDGKDYATIQAEEEARQKLQQEYTLKVEQVRRELLNQLNAEGYVNLGLPSGTLWKSKNENKTSGDHRGFYTYKEAVGTFGNCLPTKKQWEELWKECTVRSDDGGYRLTGVNGKSIYIPSYGCLGCIMDGRVHNTSTCYYWSSTLITSNSAWRFENPVSTNGECVLWVGQSVRLVMTEKELNRLAKLKAQGWIDLGLPSGTLWKDENEWNNADDHGFYTYDDAVRAFGNSMPTKEQWEELKNNCRWTWTGRGYKVVGPNGNSTVLPAAGGRYCDCGGRVFYVGTYGSYWSSAPYGYGSEAAWRLTFNSSEVSIDYDYRCSGLSVRLVQGQ